MTRDEEDVNDLHLRFDDLAGKGDGGWEETRECLPCQRRSGSDRWGKRQGAPVPPFPRYAKMITP